MTQIITTKITWYPLKVQFVTWNEQQQSHFCCSKQAKCLNFALTNPSLLAQPHRDCGAFVTNCTALLQLWVWMKVGWNIQRTLFDVFKLYLGEIRGENRFCDSLIFPVNQLDNVGGFQINRCWNVVLSDKITSLICSLSYTSYLHYYKMPLMRVRGG